MEQQNQYKGYTQQKNKEGSIILPCALMTGVFGGIAYFLTRKNKKVSLGENSLQREQKPVGRPKGSVDKKPRQKRTDSKKKLMSATTSSAEQAEAEKATSQKELSAELAKEVMQE